MIRPQQAHAALQTLAALPSPQSIHDELAPGITVERYCRDVLEKNLHSYYMVELYRGRGNTDNRIPPHLWAQVARGGSWKLAGKVNGRKPWEAAYRWVPA